MSLERNSPPSLLQELEEQNLLVSSHHNLEFPFSMTNEEFDDLLNEGFSAPPDSVPIKESEQKNLPNKRKHSRDEPLEQAKRLKPFSKSPLQPPSSTTKLTQSLIPASTAKPTKLSIQIPPAKPSMQISAAPTTPPSMQPSFTSVKNPSLLLQLMELHQVQLSIEVTLSMLMETHFSNIVFFTKMIEENNENKTIKWDTNVKSLLANENEKYKQIENFKAKSSTRTFLLSEIIEKLKFSQNELPKHIHSLRSTLITIREDLSIIGKIPTEVVTIESLNNLKRKMESLRDMIENICQKIDFKQVSTNLNQLLSTFYYGSTPDIVKNEEPKTLRNNRS